jgi:hypothetical protein
VVSLSESQRLLVTVVKCSRLATVSLECGGLFCVLYPGNFCFLLTFSWVAFGMLIAEPFSICYILLCSSTLLAGNRWGVGGGPVKVRVGLQVEIAANFDKTFEI